MFELWLVLYTHTLLMRSGAELYLAAAGYRKRSATYGRVLFTDDEWVKVR